MNVDLSLIKQNQRKHSSLQRQKVEKCIQQGFQLIDKALHNESIEIAQEALLKAFDQFSMAIKIQRRHPGPYLGLAIIMQINENFDRSLAYLKKAQELDKYDKFPELTDIISAVDEQLRAFVDRDDEGYEKIEEPQNSTDFDFYYDRIEMRILQQSQLIIKFLSRHSKIEAQSDYIQVLEQGMQKFSHHLEQINQELLIVDQELDISDLRKQLKPFEMSVKQVERLISHCREQFTFTREIQELTELILQLNQEVKSSHNPEDLPIIEENLEILIDRADGHSDTLNHIAARGHPVHKLKSYYRKMDNEFDKLEEEVESLRERLSSGDQFDF